MGFQCRSPAARNWTPPKSVRGQDTLLILTTAAAVEDAAGMAAVKKVYRSSKALDILLCLT